MTLTRLRRLLPGPTRNFLLWLIGRDKPPVGRVRFGDLGGTLPISKHFGFDRGQPVDRFYIERFLAAHAADIHGRVLEIGDNAYTLRFGGSRVAQSDVLNVHPGVPGTTLVGDLAQPGSLPAEAFDCAVLTQTLHLIYDVQAAVRHLHAALKPGGVALITFPGISQLSSDRWNQTWYWSFTTLAARRMFSDVFGPPAVQVTAFGNVLTATAFLQGLAVEDLPRNKLEPHDPHYELLITVRAQKEAV